MSDMGEMYAVLREHNKRKRAENRGNSAALLRKNRIEFEERNGGAHLIISNPVMSETIDFWPGTGKWIVRGDKTPRRGVFPLLNRLKHSISKSNKGH